MNVHPVLPAKYNMNIPLDETYARGIFSQKVQENFNLNLQEFRQKKTILASYPVKIYVEPTQKCNLTCITCWRPRSKRHKDMPLELFNVVAQDFFPYAAEVDFFLAGEPTLAPHLGTMLQKSEQFSFLPKFFTNAAYLPDMIIDVCMKVGVFVNVSFDSADAVQFCRIRRGAFFRNVVANIDKLKSRRSGAHPRFHVRLASTLNLHNIEQAPEIIEFAYQHGIDDVMFGSYDSIAWEDHFLKADETKAVLFLSEAKKRADTYRIRFSCPKQIGASVIEQNHNWHDFQLPVDAYAPFFLESRNPYQGDCGYPWLQTCVRADGSVIACCQRKHLMGYCGKEALRRIWNARPYQRLRSQNSYYLCRGKRCNMAEYSIWNAGTPRDEHIEQKTLPYRRSGEKQFVASVKKEIIAKLHNILIRRGFAESLKKGCRFTICLFCWNYAPTLAKVIENFKKEFLFARIVVFDCFSTDASCAIARDAGVEVFSLSYPDRKDFFRAMGTAVEADFYVFADVSGKYDAADAYALSVPLVRNQTDMAVGVRDFSFVWITKELQYAGSFFSTILMYSRLQRTGSDFLLQCRWGMTVVSDRAPHNQKRFRSKSVDAAEEVSDKCDVKEAGIMRGAQKSGNIKTQNCFSRAYTALRVIGTLLGDVFIFIAISVLSFDVNMFVFLGCFVCIIFFAGYIAALLLGLKFSLVGLGTAFVFILLFFVFIFMSNRQYRKSVVQILKAYARIVK